VAPLPGNHFRIVATMKEAPLIRRTGIQDAIALAGALQETLQQGNDTALNRWQEKRLEIAHFVVRMTDRMTKMATASSYGVKLLRNAVLSIVGQIPFAQHALTEKLSELENR
jgi:2-polyprenyl-6-methoxyphenol hydroxylase-like FAD-dependent oxidoreductase